MHVGQMVRVGAAVALSAALAAPTGAVAAGESASTATNVNSAAMAAGCSPAGVLSHLSRTQRVGQLFVMGVTTTGPTTYQKQMIRAHHLGGAVLMGHSSKGVNPTWRTARTLQAQARSNGVGLWVAADQEGGYVQVLHGGRFAEMPTALHQGRWRPSKLRHHAHRWGMSLNGAGVNLNLAPVMDTVPASLGRGNKPIGYYYREYGHRPGPVARHGAAVQYGMRDAGVQTTAKHFPGLGRVHRNTDTSYGVHDDVTTRHDPYLRPFRAAMNHHIPVVMVSSARYTKIDRKFLAPFSPTVLRGMIRHDLNYHGVIMSDDLGAAAAVKKVPVGKRAVRFLRAGGNVVLTVDASTIPKMTHAVLDRERNVPPFRHKVNAAALQVLQAKKRAGLLPCQHTRAGTTDPGAPAGTTRFQSFGEHLYLCDRQSDGRRVITHARTSTGFRHEYQLARGRGSCADIDLSIPEQGWARFKVCLQNGKHAPERRCSRWVRTTARG